jgi:hypothetical protein
MDSEEIVIHQSEKRSVLISHSSMVPYVDLIEVKLEGGPTIRTKRRTCVTLMDDELLLTAERLVMANSGRLLGPFERDAQRAAVGAVLLLRAIRAGSHDLAQEALNGLRVTVEGMKVFGDLLAGVKKTLDGEALGAGMGKKEA